MSLRRMKVRQTSGRCFVAIYCITFSVLAGITSLLVNGQPVLLTEALVVAPEELMGGFSPSWPLTKVLDIGGVERRPQFSDSSLSSTGKQCMACFHPVL